SSPFVLMALEEHINIASPAGYWWMNSFGAGFSSHGILLEVE
ncbi:MAG: stilbene synthase, partial [Verrucomicrobia bacterium]|nr:stilbene synthase [Verrucomicrobiota bacterium]